MLSHKTIAFVTLGCKLNFAETSTLARSFAEKGYTRVPATQQASIYVVNTCSVTAESDKKCRQAIRKLAQQHPDSHIIATGCYANLQPTEITALAPNVKVSTKPEVITLAESLSVQPVFNPSFAGKIHFFPAFSSGDRTRTFLKVQDGCNYHCTYCTVPLARGHSRNIAINDLLATAKTIASQGIQEVVLTGVNIGDFGKSTDESFFDLLKALVNVEGIARYRISSIEPNLLTDEMIDWIAESTKILPHFHIPLQSGNNKILRQMHRRYTRELLEQRVEHIRRVMPRAFIGLDVIVGFPGETPDDFEDTYQFLSQLKPAFLHIFPYSARPNTPAATFHEQVPEPEKKQRAKRLDELCRTLHRQFYEHQIGIEEQALIESTRKDDWLFGYTRNYVKIEIPYDKLLIGKIITVRTTGIASSSNMQCEILKAD